MFQLETTLARAYAITGQAAEFRERAEARKAALRHYFWNDEKGLFADYLWREDRTSDRLTAAALTPLPRPPTTTPRRQRRRRASSCRPGRRQAAPGPLQPRHHEGDLSSRQPAPTGAREPGFRPGF
jgi:neutral trehalase